MKKTHAGTKCGSACFLIRVSLTLRLGGMDSVPPPTSSGELSLTWVKDWCRLPGKAIPQALACLLGSRATKMPKGKED